MALVGEVVARFKAETGDYLAKIDAAKAKNRELATQLIATAGSAEKAMATLTVARRSGELANFGIDKREVSGVLSAIKGIERDAKQAGAAAGAGFAKSFDDRAKALEATFGEDRTVNKLLQGGLVGFAGEQVERFTKVAKDLSAELREGKISAGELVDNLAGGIPVIGSFWQAGKNVREMMDDQSRSLERQIALQQQLNDARQKTIEIVKAAKEEATQAASRTLSMVAENEARALELSGRPDLAKLKRQGGGFAEDYQKEVGALEKKRDEAVAAIDDQRAKILPQLGEAQRKASIAQANVDAIPAWVSKLPFRAGLDEARRLARETSEAAEKLQSRYDNLAKQRANVEGELTPQIDARKAAFAERQKLDNIAGAQEMGRNLAAKVADAIKGSGIEKWLSPPKPAGQTVNVAELDAKLTAQAKDLLAERDAIAMDERRVYELPHVAELRAGQSLYAPPTRVDDQQLKRLQSIDESLQKIRDKAAEAGVIIEENSI